MEEAVKKRLEEPAEEHGYNPLKESLKEQIAVIEAMIKLLRMDKPPECVEVPLNAIENVIEEMRDSIGMPNSFNPSTMDYEDGVQSLKGCLKIARTEKKTLKAIISKPTSRSLFWGVLFGAEFNSGRVLSFTDGQEYLETIPTPEGAEFSVEIRAFSQTYKRQYCNNASIVCRGQRGDKWEIVGVYYIRQVPKSAVEHKFQFIGSKDIKALRVSVDAYPSEHIHIEAMEINVSSPKK